MSTEEDHVHRWRSRRDHHHHRSAGDPPAMKPKGTQFLYHEAHLKDRDSIRSTGLRPAVPYAASDLPKGVYMAPLAHSEYSSSMNDASHFGYDRWRVNVSDLDLQVDSSQPTHTRFSPEHIGPERLRLVKKGHPNWEKHI